jgi:hypothetical protein
MGVYLDAVQASLQANMKLVEGVRGILAGKSSR